MAFALTGISAIVESETNNWGKEIYKGKGLWDPQPMGVEEGSSIGVQLQAGDETGALELWGERAIFIILFMFQTHCWIQS